MIKPILTWPNNKLKEKSIRITDFNLSIRELENDLIQTCEHHQGAGLAAIQIGIASRALVVLHESHYLFMANPIIVELGAATSLKDEGCLSFPGVTEAVKRFDACVVYYKDSFGILKELECNGLTAQATQHEIDHTEGVVLPDRLDGFRRSRFYKNYKKVV